MKVETILQAKGAAVYSVTQSTSVKGAVEMLGDKNIGAVIVKNDNGDVTGIFSERDVVRRLRTEGAGVLDRPVSDCMTRNPVTCDPNTEVDELMSRMTERRIRHIPVCEGGQVVGMVSIGDVVKRKIEDAEREAAALKEYIAS
ncbi:MAG: CBS domain-containing protein [Parvularculaceae bacterium]